MEIPDAMKMIGKAFDEFTKKYSHQLYYGKAWPDTSLPNTVMSGMEPGANPPNADGNSANDEKNEGRR
jgi:hypothetical protein